MIDSFDERVQRAAEEHLAACQEAIWEVIDGPEEHTPSPAFAPFCGCDTCVVREVLSVAWDMMLEEARKEAA